jgi:tetratricopeptide (TPR) repeat protein
MVLSVHSIKALCAMLFVALLCACNPQAKLVKQAHVQSEAGQYDEAAKLYYNILLNDQKNKDAKAGLKLNGQKVLADKFAKFSKQVIEGRIDEALRTYYYAQGFANNTAKVGVMLDWPHEYDEVYEDIKQEYTQQQYDVAIEYIKARKYEQAEKVFEQIAVYDSSYKNVSVLRLNTVLEPLYNQGLEQYKAGKYKDAYYTFKKVAQIDDQYKDALKLRNQAQTQATQLVGVFPVYYQASAKNFEGNTFNLSIKVADELSKLQGAYVKIANAKNLHKELENRGFVNINKAELAVEAGKSNNLSYVLLIEMDSFGYVKSPLQTYQRDAYESVTENILNPYTRTYSSISKFKKVQYTDKSEGQFLYMRVHYRLIDVKTGYVLYSNTLVEQRNDELHIASYNGNAANLYPSLPEGNYLPHVSEEWRSMFSNPRKQLLPTSGLYQAAIEKLSNQIVKEVKGLL